MSDLNTVTLVGRLTRDPEVRFTHAGTAIMALGLAVNGRQKDAAGNWTEKSNFFDVTFFGERFEKLAPHIGKGRRIGIVGRLDYSTWQLDDGTKRSKVVIIGSDLQFLDAPKGEAEAEASATPAAGEAGEWNTPTEPATDFGQAPAGAAAPVPAGVH